MWSKKSLSKDYMSSNRTANLRGKHRRGISYQLKTQPHYLHSQEIFEVED